MNQASTASKTLREHYRFGNFPAVDAPSLKGENGFFRFGPNVVCYGQTTGPTHATVNGKLFDAAELVRPENAAVSLPFDLKQVVDNLRYERYVRPRKAWIDRPWIKDVYYRLRPLFPVGLRRNLQKIYLQDWTKIPFPTWPVDRSVDILFEKVAIAAMRASEIDRLPFIWFWPDGCRACAIVTHDVETTVGRDFCRRLIEIDGAFGVKSSFQVVPEKRYSVPSDYLQMIRDAGCEINLHGLNHEGNLFENQQSFSESAKKINEYAKVFGSRGFRSPIMHRNVDWLHKLDFSYDMSVPNVARLEPQRGGCCSVMPYFLPGGMLEIPVTTTEDYSLFHILKDYSMSLWKEQMARIIEGNGLMSFIVHPDYVIESAAQKIYMELLQEISRLRSEAKVWVTLSGDVDRWWRERSQMKLLPDGHGFRVEGAGSERARVAYARLDHDALVYELD